MNQNHNVQLFKQEHPLWNTYSDNDLRLAMTDFCRRHNIELPNQGIQQR